MSTKSPIHNTISSASIKDAHNTNDLSQRCIDHKQAQDEAQMERVQRIVTIRFPNLVRLYCSK